jgi:hypothetical protein
MAETPNVKIRVRGPVDPQKIGVGRKQNANLANNYLKEYVNLSTQSLKRRLDLTPLHHTNRIDFLFSKAPAHGCRH